MGISIHALREEGDAMAAYKKPLAGFISIHALREEGDGLTQKLRDICQISIHALREEGDMRAQP